MEDSLAVNSEKYKYLYTATSYLITLIRSDQSIILFQWKLFKIKVFALINNYSLCIIVHMVMPT